MKKLRHLEAGKKLNDHISSYSRLINDLSEEVKLILTKVLAKNLINRYSILNSAKYFSKDDGS